MPHTNVTFGDLYWSKLPDFIYTIKEEIQKQHYDNEKRTYHNFQHINRMYAAAHKLDMKYDFNLDLAILFHDAIYDGYGDHELRSIYLFKIYAPAIKEAIARASDLTTYDLSYFDPDIVCELIASTMDHDMTNSVLKDGRLIKLDLFDLTDPSQTIINYQNIKTESKKLYSRNKVFRDTDFAKANYDFMKFLLSMVERNVSVDTGNEFYWSEVTKGIKLTMQLSLGIIEEKERLENMKGL